MGGQSKWGSFVESAVNIAVGLAIALTVNKFVLDWFGFPISHAQNATLGAVLTVASLLRQFALRRVFERLGLRLKISAHALAILAERRRQVEAEGYSPAHDDAHEQGDLALAGAAYAFNAGERSFGLGVKWGRAENGVPFWWPWHDSEWKPYGMRRDLVRAGALILAELERYARNRKRKRWVGSDPDKPWPQFAAGGYVAAPGEKPPAPMTDSGVVALTAGEHVLGWRALLDRGLSPAAYAHGKSAREQGGSSA